jgi:riboflavin kinase/FMN adenylyltransferase
MRVFPSIESIPDADFAQGSAVAIGKFDGLHLGHRAILGHVFDAAPLTPVVFTFRGNPLELLKPEACPRPLMSREQRLEAFEAAGVDTCVMVDFDEKFAAIPAERFVEEVLVGRLNAKRVVMGGNFRFGHGGAGGAALMRLLGDRLGFTVEVVDLVPDSEAGASVGPVSSSRIREALLAGDVAAAARMLGRPPAVRGEVVRGDARGRELGFPTANLGGRVEGLAPADGVYAGTVVIDDVEYPAAISVGNNPTFTPDEQSRVEAFLLDFTGDLYGRVMEVRFHAYIRGMVAFDSLEDLIARMKEDVEVTRSLLAS